MTEILSLENNPKEFVYKVSLLLTGCESSKDLFVPNKNESSGKFMCPILKEEVELSGGICQNNTCDQNYWHRK